MRRHICAGSGLVAGLALCLSHLAAASDPTQKPLLGSSNPFDENFGVYVKELLDKWHVPGVAIAVVDGDDVWAEVCLYNASLYCDRTSSKTTSRLCGLIEAQKYVNNSQGYGIATFPSTPVTPSTLFYTASTTKAFVSAALSLMIDSGNYTLPVLPPTGPPSPYRHASFQFASPEHDYTPRKLDWTTPISDVLGDDFVLQDAWATAHLTLQDALSHRTGMPRHDGAISRSYDGRTPATVRDIVRSLRHLPLSAEPRQKFMYCNLMYAVLSHCVETLTGGRWLGDLLREWIWAPLGMRTTFFSLEDALAAERDGSGAHVAGGYYWDNATASFVQAPFIGLREVSGAGGILSNVEDYARWVKCHLDEGRPVFSKEGIAAVRKPQMPIDSDGPVLFDTPQSYASGWFTSSYRGHRFWTHSGGMHAYGAEVYMFPDDKFGVVAFGNTAITSNAVEETVIWRLIDEKLNIPESKRIDWIKRWETSIGKIDIKIDGALDEMFPDRKEPGLPHNLPLESYAGTYFHPGYLNLTIQVVESEVNGKPSKTLYAERPDATWMMTYDFQHVSSEYWMVYLGMIYERSGNMREYASAQFKIGPSGKVTGLEMGYRSDGALEGNILFTRID